MTGGIQKNSFKELLEREGIERLRRALGEDARLHLVGGSVRDRLLKREAIDLDLATILLPDEVARRLASAGMRTIPTGLKHQTVTALPTKEESIEITTFRGPRMSPEGGVVASNSIEEDLAYRDFTINALAVDVASGELQDPFSGVKDLEKKTIRAIGSPEERFREDPLRILRMVRIACELGFSIEANTREAAASFAREIPNISIERVRDELSKTLLSPRPDDGMRLFVEFGFLEFILPEVCVFVGYEQNKFHKADLFLHTLEVLRKTSPDLLLRLSALLHDVGKPATLSVDENGDRHFFKHEQIGARMTREMLGRLRYSKAQIDAVGTLVRTHMRPIEAGPGGLRRLLRDTGDLYPLWRELKEADASSCKIDSETLAERLAVFDAAIEEVKKGPPVSPLSSLALNGRDLMEEGIAEGPRIGEILRALHEQVLDNPSLNTRDELLKLLETVR